MDLFVENVDPVADFVLPGDVKIDCIQLNRRVGFGRLEHAIVLDVTVRVKRFKSKGFEIVSVSVDDGTDEWIKAVKDNGMNWVQLWNGDDDIQNSAAAKYSITAIPSTFLIDSEGTIIARNLRDKELEEALEDYFK